MNALIVVLALFVAGCSGPDERRHQQIMHDIERHVQLPANAKKLQEYARYYTIDDGHVVGIFITDFDPESRYYDLPIGQRWWIDRPHD